MEANDTEAMREALRTLRQRFDNNVMAYQDRYFKFSGWHWHKKAAEAARWRDVFCELREACDAALAKPPRNCNVGTAKEQARRFLKFCVRQDCEKACPFRGCSNSYECAFAWAQMSYTEGVGK